MPLRLIFPVAFLAVASLVGLVGYLFHRTGSAVLTEVESVHDSALVEAAGATEMLQALQASQIAAQELVAERYRARVEPDHESEWGSAGDIDVDAAEDSLERFEEQLAASWRASEEAAQRERGRGRAERAEAERRRREGRLREIQSSFAVYQSLMDRFVHLARYHPSDQVREFVDDRLRSHYQSLLEDIEDYQGEAMGRLAADVTQIETAIARGNRRNVWVLVAALVGAGLLGLALARAVTRPLGALAVAARDFGRGGDPGPMRVRASHEIGQLAAAFEQMRRDLDARTVSLEEKEVLLQEIHHRVKNNLQIVSSLLRLQGDEATDPASARALQDSESRIRAMALIHEHLYRSDDLERIDFPEYVGELTRRVLVSHGPSGSTVGEGVRVELDVDPVPLDLDHAIPFGMIVNELVVNALEHAFGPGGDGRVTVTFRDDADADAYRLAVADDGRGLPPGFDPAEQTSLGLKLVAALAEQLDGRLEAAEAPGGGAVLRVVCARPSRAGADEGEAAA